MFWHTNWDTKSGAEMGTSLPSYLFQRNQIWYFRQRVPVDLVPLFGRKDFKSSLKTQDVGIAKRRAVSMASRLWSQFEVIQSEIMKKKDESFAELITLKNIKIGNNELGEVSIDHNGNAEKEQATLNAFLGVIKQAKQDNLSQHNTQKTQDNICLTDAINEYIANKRDEVDNTSRSDEKTISATHGKLKRLVEFFGNVLVNSLLRKDAERFRNALMKLPTNLNKHSEYRGLSLNEVLALKPKNTLSTSTVKSYIEVASTFYKWCKHNQYSQTNPFESLGVRKPNGAKKEIEERDPWEPCQLSRIFSTPVFTSHEFLHSYYYWLPLIGLHTGARMNEICQLYHDDIVKIDNRLFFRFCDDREDQKLKTRNSRRVVPVHQTLLDLNFEEYLNESKKAGDERIFQSLTHSRDGYSKNASNWFSRYRKQHELTMENKKQDFHSFRHNVSDFFKQHDIPDTHAAAVLGHADQSITYGRYGKNLQAKKLVGLIDKLDFAKHMKSVQPWFYRNIK